MRAVQHIAGLGNDRAPQEETGSRTAPHPSAKLFQLRVGWVAICTPWHDLVWRSVWCAGGGVVVEGGWWWKGGLGRKGLCVPLLLRCFAPMRATHATLRRMSVARLRLWEEEGVVVQDGWEVGREVGRRRG